MCLVNMCCPSFRCCRLHRAQPVAPSHAHTDEGGGRNQGSKELVRVEATMRRLGYKIGEWDLSLSAHSVDHAFNQRYVGGRAARMSYSDWKNQQVLSAEPRGGQECAMAVWV